MRMGGMLGLSDDTATHTADLDGPEGRIVAQRGLFTGPSLLVPEELYTGCLLYTSDAADEL